MILKFISWHLKNFNPSTPRFCTIFYSSPRPITSYKLTETDCSITSSWFLRHCLNVDSYFEFVAIYAIIINLQGAWLRSRNGTVIATRILIALWIVDTGRTIFIALKLKEVNQLKVVLVNQWYDRTHIEITKNWFIIYDYKKC